MRWRHVYLWCSAPAGQPILQGRTVEFMVCSSDRTLGLLNLAVGADSNGFLGTHTYTHIFSFETCGQSSSPRPRARTHWPKCISHWSRGNTGTLSHPWPALWACYDGVSDPTRGRQCGLYGSNREDLVKMVQPPARAHTHTMPDAAHYTPHDPLCPCNTIMRRSRSRTASSGRLRGIGSSVRRWQTLGRRRPCHPRGHA